MSNAFVTIKMCYVYNQWYGAPHCILETPEATRLITWRHVPKKTRLYLTFLTETQSQNFHKKIHPVQKFSLACSFKAITNK